MSLIDAIIAKKLCGSGGGGSVPKPLTYDYMPEGYPTKTTQTITLMEEQEIAFVSQGDGLPNIGTPTTTFIPVEGQTYIVNWDGTEHECVCSIFNNTILILGNLSIEGVGDNTGEPFAYAYNSIRDAGGFSTLDTSASHTISVKTAAEVITPMAEEFLPAAPKNTTVFYT